MAENSIPSWLTDALVLAGLTALCYVYAASYETAYLYHFGVGPEFLSLSFEQLAVVALPLMILTGFLFIVINGLTMLFRGFGFVFRHAMMPFAFSVAAVAQYFAGQRGFAFYFYCVAAIVLWFLAFYGPWARVRNGLSVSEAIRADVDTEDKYHQGSLARKLTERFGLLPFFMMIAVLPVPLFVAALGSTRASNQQQFDTFELNGTWLLIKKNSDELIFVGFNADQNSLNGEILVRRLDSGSSVQLRHLVLETAPKTVQ